jgi:hypothetical protein
MQLLTNVSGKLAASIYRFREPILFAYVLPAV